jgi:hypothetical protein
MRELPSSASSQSLPRIGIEKRELLMQRTGKVDGKAERGNFTCKFHHYFLNLITWTVLVSDDEKTNIFAHIQTAGGSAAGMETG